MRTAARRGLRWLALRTLVLLVVGSVAYGAWLDLKVRSQFEGRRWQVPARIYARPLELFPGAPVSLDTVLAELAAAGYHRDVRLGRPASFHRKGSRLSVRTRSFRFWDAGEPEQVLRLDFEDGRLAALRNDAGEVAVVRLEPLLIGRIHPAHQQDRVLVRLDEVPKSFVAALLAVEDRRFFEHSGVSPRGIARALVANLRAGATVQGGSTLTQQLAKSFFLTSERSLWRKLNDVLIALILEARYSKEAILESYLNEVYLGQDGPRAVHGFGLGARHYFDRRLDELSLPEVALLAGMVKGPSLYNPRRHRQRALERRNLVLQQMGEQGVIDAETVRRAQASELGVTPRPGDAGSRYPGFLDLVRRQLRRDYRDEDLRSEGLRVFTTLDPGVQDRAQQALGRELDAIESRRGKEDQQRLQGAVVVTEPQSAEVLALVSGRDGSAAGFNRALDARRPIGSLIKPVVYLSALARPERYTLATALEDAPVRLTGARGEPWEPKNYDGEVHGRVALIEALSQSYNLATVRLGMEVGLDSVRENLARMGVEHAVNRYPSLLLGAVDLTPVEVTGIYQTLAAGGFRQPLRAIREVTDADGRPLERYGFNVEEAVDPRAAFLTVRAMQEVMRSGTGRSAAADLPPGVAAAGKTGTTDDLRDSWFAGFAGDRLAVVWVGRDDNAPARLTGASGALRVWRRFFSGLSLRTPGVQPPQGIFWATPVTGPAGGIELQCGKDSLASLPFMDAGPMAGLCSGVGNAPMAPAAPPAPSADGRWKARRAEDAH